MSLMLLFLPCSMAGKGNVQQKVKHGLYVAVSTDYAVTERFDEILRENGCRPLYGRGNMELWSLGWTARIVHGLPFYHQAGVNITRPMRDHGRSERATYGAYIGLMYDFLKHSRWMTGPAVSCGCNRSVLTLKSELADSMLSDGALDEEFYRNDGNIRVGVNMGYSFHLLNQELFISLMPYYRLEFGNDNWHNTKRRLVDEKNHIYGESCWGVQVQVSFFVSSVAIYKKSREW